MSYLLSAKILDYWLKHPGCTGEALALLKKKSHSIQFEFDSIQFNEKMIFIGSLRVEKDGRVVEQEVYSLEESKVNEYLCSLEFSELLEMRIKELFLILEENYGE